MGLLQPHGRHGRGDGQADLISAVAKFRTLDHVDVKGRRVLVRVDLNHNPASSTVDSLETAVLEGKLVRVVSWYDNEWGFSNRMVDTAGAMTKLI